MTRQQLRKQGTSSVCLLCRHSLIRVQELRPQRLHHFSTLFRTAVLTPTSTRPRENQNALLERARRVLDTYTGLRRIHSNGESPSYHESPDNRTIRPKASTNQPWSLGGQNSWGGGWGSTSNGPTSRTGPNLQTNPEGDGNLLPHEKLARDRARMKAAAAEPAESAVRAPDPKKDSAATSLTSNNEIRRPRIGGEDFGRVRRRESPAPAFPSKASSKGPGHHSPRNRDMAPSTRGQMHSSLSPRSGPSPGSRGPPRPSELDPQAFERNRARWRENGPRGSAPRRTNEIFNALGDSTANHAPRPPTRSIPGASNASVSDTQEWGQLNRRNSSSTQHSSGWGDKTNTLHRRRPDPRKTARKPGLGNAENDTFAAQFNNAIADSETTRHARTSTDWGRSRTDKAVPASEAEKDDQSFDAVAPPVTARPSHPSTRYTDERTRGWDRDRDRDRDRAEKPKKKAKNQRRNSYREIEEDEEDRAWLRAEEKRRWKEERQAQKERELAAAGPVPILLPEFISVSNLAGALGVKSEQFIEQLGELGFENISYDSIMTGETAALVAGEYGFEPTVDTGASVDLKPRPPPSDPSLLPPRPPIVTIMGHVDHGKTTMLDWLRKSSIAAQEHGGITQHIGAFSVKLSTGKQITFLDTPGHAAFLTMRQRGANVTDIVILVVAADDSVKPQTLEALKHARAAKVPIIVAINKVDKDEARIDQVKADLARHGVEIEDFGGDVQVVCVSGKTGQGMNDLEENILTLSEIIDVRAETDGMAEGWILEASVKPVGKVATVLVKRGTLRRGDFIVAGATWAKIKVLRNEAGVDIAEAPPGTAVEILGWKDPPAAGDEVLQAPDESKAKAATHYREEIREREKAVATKVAQEQEEREKAEKEELEENTETEESGTKIVNFLVKGDVVGSVEAVCAAVLEIGNNEVRPRVLRSSAGQITESDVDHAAASKSLIINFNNPVPGFIKRRAEDAKVRILDHNVIYHLTDEVKDKLSDELTPTISTRVVGEAEVLQVFPINLKARVYKNIAGCRVRNGQITKSSKYRVMRKGEKVFEGSADSLKHGKKDVNEMKKGAECGISFEGWEDMQQGDQIQAYEETQEKRHL